MSNLEFNYWQAYFIEKNRLEEEASKKGSKKKSTQDLLKDKEFKRTMGTTQ